MIVSTVLAAPWTVSDTRRDEPTPRQPRRRATWLVALGIVALLISTPAGSAWAATIAPQTLASSSSAITADSCAASPATSCPPPTATTGKLDVTAQAQPTPPPCAGEGCIPQPTTTSPDPSLLPPVGGGGTTAPSCGITDLNGCVTAAINSLFRELVDTALSPILDLIGHIALTTPTVNELPGISDLWNSSWKLMLGLYGLFVLATGVVVMSHESIQSRYSIKEIGPRIPLAFLASALSLFLVDKMIALANALTLAVLGSEIDPAGLGRTFQAAVVGAETGGLFTVVVALLLVGVGVALLIVSAVRVVIMLVLATSGPLFLMCHALPQTDGLARWWWKAVIATLGIQVAQAFVLITAVRTFLAAGVHLFDSTLSALGTLIAAIALFLVLFKIPFWMLSAIKVGSGRSFTGRLVRTIVAAKTFGLIASKTGLLGTTRTTNSTSRARSSSAGNGRQRAGATAPPQPAQSRTAAAPATVARRLKQAHDAERLRAARRPRLPSQAPTFLQPQPQQTTHDPAITPGALGPTTPEFSSAPPPSTPSPAQRRTRPTSPTFQAQGAPPRRGAAPPPARPIRAASTPARLRFQPAIPTSDPSATPLKATQPPAPPAFREAQPPPRIGDARKRTPAVPPVAFRPPPPRGGRST